MEYSQLINKDNIFFYCLWLRICFALFCLAKQIPPRPFRTSLGERIEPKASQYSSVLLVPFQCIPPTPYQRKDGSHLVPENLVLKRLENEVGHEVSAPSPDSNSQKGQEHHKRTPMQQIRSCKSDLTQHLNLKLAT